VTDATSGAPATVGTATPAVRPAARRRRRRARLRSSLLAYLFLLPALAVLGVFVLYPFLDNFSLALYSSPPSPLLPKKFIGWSQVTSVLTDPSFLSGLKETFAYTLMVVPASIILGLLLAVVANQKLRGRGVYRVIFATTIVSSVAVAGAVFGTLLDPVVGFLPWLGIHINPLTSATWALPATAVIGIWSFMGLAFLLFTAALQSLPEEVFDAARCDRAGWWSTLTRVTIPMLSPTILYTVIVGTIGAMFSFGTIDLLIGQDAPAVNANVLAYQIYEAIQVDNNQSRAATISIVLFVITGILALIQFRFLSRRVTYEH
jgi:sn-glycerol 3-phosphate transport system permease protein